MGLRSRWMIRLVTRVSVATGLSLVLMTLAVAASQDDTAADKRKADSPQTDVNDAPASKVKLGLSINDARAFQGYTLIASLMSTKTYLIDMQGRVVRAWEADCNPGVGAYLLEGGNLLRPGSLMGEEMSFGGGPGAGGRVQEFTWDGDLVWDFKLFNDKQLPHHDITRLPNGNVLMIVWDKKTTEEAIAAGRRPEAVGDSHFLPDSLIEIQPTGKTSGEIVWEWHLWDHLVQDYDNSKANYGNVAEHPELVDINYGEDMIAAVAATKAGADKLKSIGYVGATTTPGRVPRVNPDWTHFNAVAYNAALDQIVVSVHAFSEFWIIDHSTTTAEAASHSGGRSGKGGDLLYRWGNPRVYRMGTKADQRLFAQHNAHWIPEGLPGAGHMLVFNNGGGRPDGTYSSVDEIVLPVDSEGRYYRESATVYGPDQPIWSYTAPQKTDFHSFFISGAQRLPNGNTLICSGANGTVFEVTPDKEVLWKYVNPTKAKPGPGGFATPGQIMPSFMPDALKMSAEQKEQLSELQKEIDGKLDMVLTDEQKKQFKDRPQFAPGVPGGAPPPPGQIMTTTEQDRLKLTAEQKEQLNEMQKNLDEAIDKMLQDEQKKKLREARSGFPFVTPGGGPPPQPAGGPGGFGGPPQPGQVLPSLLQDMLELTVEQRTQLEEFQKEVSSKLDKLLTEEQNKQLKEPQGSGPGGFAGIPQPGQLMSPTLQARLKLTADQKKQVREIQQETDEMLEKLLTDQQKKHLKDMQQSFARGGPGGAGGPPGGPGGPVGPGGGPAFGPPGGSSLFRAYRYAASDPALVGKDLTPGKTVEELQPKEPENSKSDAKDQ